MKPFAFLSTKEIKCDVPFIIGDSSSRKYINIMMNDMKQPAITVEYYNGSYYLNKEFRRFAAMLSFAPLELFRCNVLEFPNTNEDERLLRVLSNCFLESYTPWHVKYTIIQRLKTIFLYNDETLAHKVRVSKSEIRKFDIHEGVPNHVKALAIENGVGPHVNEIYKSKHFTEQQKEILYLLTIDPVNHLSLSDIKNIIKYISVGYNITFDLELFPKQIQEIVSFKDYVEYIYWDNINSKYCNTYSVASSYSRNRNENIQ
ncbi:hypothetical protein [Sutcliffiella cohnii]|uniref:hypothetical protein n=1 Tax=Sutcliffiella cohnii TaxID=33932 RepID=UPI002E247CC9|nr:hypothetical protein [Sutcliffiella cohnii]